MNSGIVHLSSLSSLTISPWTHVRLLLETQHFHFRRPGDALGSIVILCRNIAMERSHKIHRVGCSSVTSGVVSCFHLYYKDLEGLYKSIRI